jgi:hypothetical protein
VQTIVQLELLLEMRLVGVHRLELDGDAVAVANVAAEETVAERAGAQRLLNAPPAVHNLPDHYLLVLLPVSAFAFLRVVGVYD